MCCLVARVGRVTVFYYAVSFNQDIDSWDVSAVTTMEYSKCLPYSRTFFSLFHRSPEGLRVQGSCATTTAHGRSPFTCRAPLIFTCLACFPLRIRSKTFLNSDRASFFLLVWCVLCCLVARVGPVTVFGRADAFNQDISRWDVSAVTSMRGSKCLPSLARSFPLLHRSPEGLRVQGSCATTTANRPQSFHVPRGFGLHLPCSLPLANPFEDLF